MSLHLPALYHWSPADRRDRIIVDGLAPGSPPTAGSSTAIGAVDDSASGRPMVCLGPDAATAWAYSGGTGWCDHISDWDLWQVHIDEADEVFVMPFQGRGLCEIRVANVIPASRIIHLASKGPM